MTRTKGYRSAQTLWPAIVGHQLTGGEAAQKLTDGLRDAFAGVSVAVRIVCARHGLVCLRIVQESVAFGDDTFTPGPHQSGGAGENGFGPFGLSRITSTGFPSDGASSWIPPELTKDQQRQILNRHDHSNTEIRQTW